MQDRLNGRLLLFDTGIRRRARDSIKDALCKPNHAALREIRTLPGLLASAFKAGDIDFLSKALDQQEHYRGQMSSLCRSERTNKLLKIARECGAGARLTGAGLGCLLCYCHEDRQTMLRNQLGLPEIKFSILW
jgi:galactokinase/mevalonate kinase-like predicted kinase